ncbi:MAG: aldehyde ferredoxin oxidoreductase family protein [Candidatus Bathyarchaeota archaeon]|nr:MAG: aldehyde ferredoxin oxidoreductase family protein [Candidatus Bathyarchaeota archaeon]
MGQILRINLSDRSVTKEPLPLTMARDYIGGRGFGSRIIYDALRNPAEVDPLGPENVLIFSAGPLNGTMSPSSGRYTVTTKSPLTGLLGDANSGGAFGAVMKFAGYDVIVVEGQAKDTVYVNIGDDKVEILPASELRGKGIMETTDKLVEKHGRNTKVACIGLAGENTVSCAAIASDKFHYAARCAVGAVMGSKRLKAIAINGSRDIRLADPEAFLKKVGECHEKIKADKTYLDFSYYGTSLITDIAAESGGLSTRNGQTGVFQHIDNYSSHNYRENYVRRSESCFSCIIHCSNYAVVEEGKYKCRGKGPEYESFVALGTRPDLPDIEPVIYANYLCNDYGMDTISAGGIIAFLFECSEKGLIPENYTWGDADQVIDLLTKIALREGIGEDAARGMRYLADKIGRGCHDFALHTKGLELPAYDPRTGKGFGLGLAVASRGGDHLRALPNFELLSYSPEEGVKWFGDPNTVDPYAWQGKADMVLWHENFAAVVDSAEMCKYCMFATYAILPGDVAELVTHATGVDWDEESIMRAGERILNIERLFNLACGLTPEQDSLPRRFLEEPLPEGPAKGQVVELDKMLPRYYEARGWGSDGRPKKKKLEELGIENQADSHR